MPTLGNLTVDLRLLSAKFEQGLDRAQRRMGRFSKGINAARVAMAGFSGVLATVGFGSLVRESVQYADSIAKTADKVGVSTSALQELRFAAEQSGVATNTLDMALQRFSRRVGEAAQGSGELKDTLKSYGIEVRDANGQTRTTEAVLNDLADVIQRAGSDQERLRIAFKAFDSEGAAFVNALRNGSDGLDEFRDRAKELGLVMEEDVIRNAEIVNDRFNELSQTIGVRLKSATLEATDFLGQLADRFKDIDELSTFQQLDIRMQQLFRRRDALLGQITPAKKAGVADSAIRPLLDQLEVVDAEINQVNEKLLNLGRAANDKDIDTSNIISTKDVKIKAVEGFDDVPGELAFAFDKARDATEKFNKAMEDGALPHEQYIADLEAEVRNLEYIAAGRDEELDAIQAVTEANRRAADLGIELTDKELERLEELIRKRGELKDVIKENDEALKEQESTARDVGLTFESAFEDAIVEGKKLSDVLKDLAKDLLRLFVRRKVTEPLLDAFDGFLNPSGGGKAIGGPVKSGTPYLVGERGPELFMPSTSGNIIPNNRIGGGFSIQQNISIAANGDAALRQVAAEAASRGAQEGYALVQQDMARNGPIRRSIA